MFIAIRDIRRAAGRFGLLVGAVALLVLLLLFFQAVAGSLTLGLTGGAEQSSSDIWVYDARARNNPAASVLPLGVVDSIADIDGVAEAGPIGLSIFVASLQGADLEVVLLGGNPSGPAGPSMISSGDRPSAVGEAIFSGASLAGDQFELGDHIELHGQTITVVGVADDAAFNVLPTFYVPFETYAAAVANRINTETATEFDVPASVIGVRVDGSADPAAVASSINEGVDGVTALTRSDAVDALPGVSTITQSFDILYLLLYIVVTIVTGVFFLILTVQKAQSLVLLRAIGASELDVIKPILIEVLVVVGAGSLLGSAAAWSLLRFSRDTFGAQLDTATILTSVGAVIILGFVASIAALRRVLAIDPLGATRKGGVQL